MQLNREAYLVNSYVCSLLHIIPILLLKFKGIFFADEAMSHQEKKVVLPLILLKERIMY